MTVLWRRRTWTCQRRGQHCWKEAALDPLLLSLWLQHSSLYLWCTSISKDEGISVTKSIISYSEIQSFLWCLELPVGVWLVRLELVVAVDPLALLIRNNHPLIEPVKIDQVDLQWNWEKRGLSRAGFAVRDKCKNNTGHLIKRGDCKASRLEGARYLKGHQKI